MSAIAQAARRVDGGKAPTVDRPQRASFEEFLLKDARVPVGGGEHGPYTFEGREAIRGIVRRIDAIIGDGPETTLPDSLLGVAGGAQWGKTIMELNLAAYVTSQRWLAAGLFLPDDNLVQGIVDTKLRPDVIDQIPWFAEMTQVGKAVNKSGKATNRKGAFLVTDGQRKATGMVMGLQRIPTSFTFDVTLQDEVDDIPPKNAKYVKGRRTSSKLRFDVRIGTQRVYGRGQQKVWKDGSQGVVMFGPVGTETGEAGDDVLAVPPAWLNPEEAFPAIVRCQMGSRPAASDPKLTWAGDFKHDDAGQTVAVHLPTHRYYLAHPESGIPLNRRHPLWLHRAPGRFEQRAWTYRAAQFGFDAIGLSQIVAQFQLAVADPEEMTVFRCDVMALPQSTAQALSPSVIDRAQAVAPYDLRLVREPGRAAYAGLDTGDQCWLWVRETESPERRRLIYAAKMPAGDLVQRVVNLGLGQKLWDVLFMDQRPLVSQAHDIVLALNGLTALPTWPVPDAAAHLSIGNLRWNPDRARWTGIKAAVVRFDRKKLGQGIRHGFDIFTEGGQEKFVPLVDCNRFETIDRAVRELLTPAESVVEVVNGRIREEPSMLLPRKGSAPIVAEVESHLITGSERGKESDGTLGDYVDQTANHLLLADGYSALAEQEFGETRRSAPFFYKAVSSLPGHSRMDRELEIPRGRRVLL